MTRTQQQSSIILPAQRLGKVEEYYFSKKLRQIAQMCQAGHEVFNLGIGSPDLPPHPSVIQALHQASTATDAHGYQPYKGLPELRAAFARWYAHFFEVSLQPEQEVLPLMGSKEGILHISMAFLNPGDEVLVPDPGYPAYQAASELAGASVRTYGLTAQNGWLPDLECLEQQDMRRVKIMWLNYPNMPTGTNGNRTLFEKIIAFAQRHQILVVNDNPYAFILTQQQHSILSVTGAKSVALELNSLSKSHNMAGWRVGMLAGAKSYLDTVLRFKSNMDSGMYKPIQQAAIQALSLPKSWHENLNTTYTKRRLLAQQLLEALGCTFDKKQVGLFVWAAIPAHVESDLAFSEQLLHQKHIFLTPGRIFGTNGRGYIRVSLCNPVSIFEKSLQRLRS